MFYGATGTGKTLLAAIVTQEKMKRGISVAGNTTVGVDKVLTVVFSGRTEIEPHRYA